MKVPPSARDARVFAARMHALARAQAFVDAFARAHGVGDDDALRLQLVVEELFSNTVQHGYGRECDEPIEIALEARDGEVTLLYRDAARAYDPLSALGASRNAMRASVDRRPIGGLGVPLVAGVAEDIDYAFRDGRNCLRVTLRRQPPAE